jgi:release factor glutamine methyltransferase
MNVRNASFARVIGTDISLDALAVARANADRLAPGLASRVELASGSFLAPAARLLGAERARAIVSNPPYIAYAEREALPRSVRDWEPPLALFAADEGMAAIRAIARDAATLLEPDGLLAIEVDERRASLAAAAVADHGAYRDVGIRLDLAGRERFVLGRRAR